MDEGRKSDRPIVPRKPANKSRAPSRSAERVEERGLAKGNSDRQTRFWTQSQIDLLHALDRIRQAVTHGCASDLRQEPGAVVPHAGICAGGGP